MAGRVKNTRSSTRVLEFLKRNANLELTYVEIQRACELPAYAVSNAIGHLISKGFDIQKPMRGVAVFRAGGMKESTKPESKLYEFVGTSQGKVIVRGEDNELYVIAPLFSGDSG